MYGYKTLNPEITQKHTRNGLYTDFIVVTRKKPLSFDSKFAHGVEEVFPLLFLGAQTLFVLVETAAHRSGLLGPQIQGLVLLPLSQRFNKAAYLKK